MPSVGYLNSYLPADNWGGGYCISFYSPTIQPEIKCAINQLHYGANVFAGYEQRMGCTIYHLLWACNHTRYEPLPQLYHFKTILGLAAMRHFHTTGLGLGPGSISDHVCAVH